MGRTERVKGLCEAALEDGASANTGAGITIRTQLIDELRSCPNHELMKQLKSAESPVEREVIETILHGRQTIPGLFI
ncbi:MAG: hypothetical protein ABIA92_04370 [Patescibacteria group bacterium]